MKERPLDFSLEMVNEILSGRKTATRLPLEPQPKVTNNIFSFGNPPVEAGDKIWVQEIYTEESPHIKLDVKSVRLDKLHDITEQETAAEGMSKESFISLWESIYHETDFRWKANPWVWVIDFEKIENDR